MLKLNNRKEKENRLVQLDHRENKIVKKPRRMKEKTEKQF